MLKTRLLARLVPQRAAATRAAPPAEATAFCLRTHTWRTGTDGGASTWRVGLTDRAFDDAGDLRTVTTDVEVGAFVRANQTLVRAEWDAFKISDGDELYHTIWESVEGEIALRSPFNATVVAVNSATLSDPASVGPDDWLVELAPLPDTLLDVLDEKSYLAQCGAGQFADEGDAQGPYR